eukprot:UN03307
MALLGGEPYYQNSKKITNSLPLRCFIKTIQRQVEKINIFHTLKTKTIKLKLKKEWIKKQKSTKKRSSVIIKGYQNSLMCVCFVLFD